MSGTEDISFVELIQQRRIMWKDDKMLSAEIYTDKSVFCRGTVVPGITSGPTICAARNTDDVPYKAYFNTLQTTAGQGYRLHKIISGTTTRLGTEGITLTAGLQYPTKISCVGNTIKAYRGDYSNQDVDPTPKIIVTDSAIASGRFGVDNGGRTYVQTTAKNTYLFSSYWSARLQPAASPAPTPRDYVEVPIVGRGTIKNPYRAKMPTGVSYSAVIPTDNNGKPKHKKTVVRIFGDRVPKRLRGKISRQKKRLRGKITRQKAIDRAKQLDSILQDSDFTSENGW
jgi:hypothetical protein